MTRFNDYIISFHDCKGVLEGYANRISWRGPGLGTTISYMRYPPNRLDTSYEDVCLMPDWKRYFPHQRLGYLEILGVEVGREAVEAARRFNLSFRAERIGIGYGTLRFPTNFDPESDVWMSEMEAKRDVCRRNMEFFVELQYLCVNISDDYPAPELALFLGK